MREYTLEELAVDFLDKPENSVCKLGLFLALRNDSFWFKHNRNLTYTPRTSEELALLKVQFARLQEQQKRTVNIQKWIKQLESGEWNANTKITFSDNVTIDGQELKKGTYAIFTIPNETSWDVIFYSDSNNWGAPQKWDESKVAAKTTVQLQELPMTIESFTVMIGNVKTNSAELGIFWENTYAGVTFEVPTDKITSKSIENVMAGPSGNDYFQAASYYHTEGKDLKQALAWMKKATEGDNPPFWYLRRKALIQAEMGDYKNAIEYYKESLNYFNQKNDSLGLAKVNNSIGLIHIKLGNYTQGLNYSLSAISIFEKKNLKQELSIAYNNLAEAYFNTYKLEKSLEYNQKALDVRKDLNDKVDQYELDTIKMFESKPEIKEN